LLADSASIEGEGENARLLDSSVVLSTSGGRSLHQLQQ
jgi:hypothetical protein